MIVLIFLCQIGLKMEAKYAVSCKDILNKIQNNEPLTKIRTEWINLQSRYITQCINTTENTMPNEMEPKKCAWKEDCEASETDSRPILTTNKLSVEINQDIDTESITNFIRNGIFNFGIDLSFGSVKQNLDMLVRLQEAALQESQNLGYTIPLSTYLKLSPREQYTGRVFKNRESFNLKRNKRIILTANRKYASHCCDKIIYVNAKFLMFDLQKCDIICLGDDIQLLIEELKFDSAICKVIYPGVVTSRMPVKFPWTFDWINSRVSAEELEDMTFAMGTNINVIVSYSSGCPVFYKQMRDTLAEFKYDNYYLFTRLTLSNLKTVEDAEWIANSYDGFLLDCSTEPPKNTIVKLSNIAREFIQRAHQRKKPLILCGTWSTFIHSLDYKSAFYYPDKYVLPCKPSYLHLFEAVFNSLAPEMCMNVDFVDKSLTGSNTLARSIAAASFDFRADAIVMATVVGQMAIKISHFRPKAPIIAVTNIRSIINYTSLHHNIWMLFFDPNNDISHKKDTHQKLIYGVQYGVLKQVINHNSSIILVYRKLLRFGYTDKFVVIKYGDGYVETIKQAILQK